MDPRLNRNNFYDQNDGVQEAKMYSSPFNYSYYIQFRLNNTLLLLSNPMLMEQLGVDKSGLLEEAKNLIDISNIVSIPEAVQENQKRGNSR